MTKKNKILAVYVYTNDMVMVFDQHGKQMPKFQGDYYTNLKDTILNNSNESTEFYLSDWFTKKSAKLTREEFGNPNILQIFKNFFITE